MWYLLILIIMLSLSFAIVEYFICIKRRRYKIVKPLSKMNQKEFKKAMKNLEIK